MNKNFWLKLKKNRPILALAPMAGITDTAFRTICREMGADVVYSEMVSADALFYDSKKTIEMLKINKKEHPIVVQLFGKRPELFCKAAKIVENVGADGIDINFGCPAKKVVNHGGGVTLMRDLPLCKKIVQSVLDAIDIPVSIKIRAGIELNKTIKQKNNETKKHVVTAVDFVKCIIDLPIAAIMIHGRTYEQGFSGDVDYEMIKKVVELVEDKIVVLANGGIKFPEDAKIMLEKTGADGMGLAQGALGKPWLFDEIREYLKYSQSKTVSTLQNKGDVNVEEIKKIAMRHATLAYKMKGGHGIVEMRKHLLWYVKGWTNAKELREKLVRVESVEDVKRVLSIKY